MAVTSQDEAGVFVALVGPSGVGKDSLIAYARERLSGDPRFVFVRRIVTRTADVDLEDHDTWTPAAFEQGIRDGRFALSWQAHNLSYGLPADIRSDIAKGHVVIANISRQSIGAARSEFDNCRIVSVTAPREVLTQRLLARGRESVAEVEARLNRAMSPVTGSDVLEIVNGGALDEAGDKLVHMLCGLAVGEAV